MKTENARILMKTPMHLATQYTFISLNLSINTDLKLVFSTLTIARSLWRCSNIGLSCLSPKTCIMVASNYVILISGNQRSVQVSIVPQQPPSYTEPSHKPPTYEEAISQHIGQNVHVTYPGMVPSNMDEYAYQPPRKYCVCCAVCHFETGLQGYYKTFLMLNSTEHETYPAHKR